MRFTLPRLTLAALAALALACFGGPASVSAQDLIITGVVDGPLSGGTPKAVELYATSDIADLSAYGISSANNGGGPTGAPEFTFPADAATQGDFIYVASESTEFNNFFSFDPDYTSGAASINGDDAIELFFNGSVVDVFGDVNADGNGEPWEYLDGWAYRTDGTGPDGSTFVLNNWTFSGPDALDGEASNSTAATPFPIGTYQPSASTTTTVQFATGTDAVPEGDGGTTDVTVDVTITNPDAGAATDVTLAVGGTADGADATVSPTSVTFPAGSSAAQTITITVTGDTDAEPDETLELSFASVTGGNSAAAGAPSTYTLTITNDDFDISLPFTEDFEGAGLGAFFAFDVAGPTDVWAQDTDGGNSFADINGFGDEADEDWLISPTFDLSGTTSEELSVDTQERFGGAELELLFSTDYAGTGDPTTATWTELVGPDGGTPSFPNTSDGNTFSPFETTTVSLPSAAATASAVYFAFKYTADGNPGGSEHWRVDNFEIREVTGTDLAIAPDNADQSEGDSGTTPFTFTVTRSGETSGSTDVDFAVTGSGTDAADATDFDGGTLPSGTVSFAATETEQTITIDVAGDTDVEPDETFTVTLSNPSGGATITTATADGTIRTDDFDASLPFTENFEGAGLGAFFAFDVAGPTDVWAQDNDASGNSFADINGFGDEADEDWLISPAFDLSGTTSEELSVDTQERFGGAELELLFSTDYAGTGDPTTATWTELVGPDGGTPSFPNTSDGSDFSPFETTTVSLPSAAATASTVYFAFKYTADGNPGGSEHWRVDNVTLTGSVPVPNAWINEFSYDNDGGDVDEQIEVIVETGADITGLEVVLYNGNGGDPYDTIPLADFTQSTAESQPDFDFYVYNTTNDTPLQNGNDGLALCFNGAVVQSGGVDVLLSYEGEFTANSGCAAGLLLPGIPADAEQTGSTPVTQSVQLQGAGTDYGTLVASSWELDTSSFGTPNANQPLPVELAAFDAVPQPDGAVRLTWSTASETNNAGFEVQQRTGTDGAFRELGFVAGTGTTTEAQTYGFTVEDLPAGTHTFRLRQLDFDGQGTLSPTVETTIEVRGRYALTAPAPNPFAPGRASTMTLTVPETQRVTVAVYNVLGQRVATLFDGTLEANDARELTLPARGLASGVYLYRVQGEGFTATRRATLVR